MYWRRLQLYWKQIPIYVFFCAYCKTFKKTYFEKHLRMAAFADKRVLYKPECFIKRIKGIWKFNPTVFKTECYRWINETKKSFTWLVCLFVNRFTIRLSKMVQLCHSLLTIVKTIGQNYNTEFSRTILAGDLKLNCDIKENISWKRWLKSSVCSCIFHFSSKSSFHAPSLSAIKSILVCKIKVCKQF